MTPIHEPGLVTVIGRRGPAEVDRALELLRRNGVDHRWVDLDRDPLATLLDARELEDVRLPLIVFFSLQRYFVRGLLAGSVKG